jgi:hypothetical protein
LKCLIKACARTSFFLLLPLALISGCGQTDDAGKDLGIDVHPSDDALISLGPVATCLDRASFLKGTAASVSLTAGGYVLIFNRFTLEWRSTDTLFLKALRIKIEGSGIKDGIYETTIAPDEVAALIARDQAIVTSAVTIISSDAPSRAGTGFAPCGLVIGNIPLTDGDKTKQFRARVTVTAIGTAEDSAANDRFVRQTITATGMFYGG